MSYYTVNFIISLYATIHSYINYRSLKKSQYQINNNERSELKLISKLTLINFLEFIIYYL